MRSELVRTRSTSTANSSPPSRATVSHPRVAFSSRLETSISSRSPTAWPSESLTFLKLSRSRNSTAIDSGAEAPDLDGHDAEHDEVHQQRACRSAQRWRNGLKQR